MLLSAVAEYDARGKFVRALTVLTDMTDKKSAAEELRYRNALLSVQRDAVIGGLLVVDLDRHWLDYNRRFIDMWGIPPEIEAAKSSELAVQFVLHKLVDPEAFEAGILELVASPLKRSTEEIELVDGRVFERFSAPLLGDDGSHYGRLWSYKDITESKGLENQLRQAQKMEDIGRLTAGIAHNFNNMLQGIIGNIELARYDEGNGSLLLGDSLAVAGRAGDMVRQLMLFARQGIASDRKPCDVAALVDNVVGICRSTFDRQLRISVETQPGLGHIWGDASQLEQVLLNLLINARDAAIEAPESSSRNRIEIRAYSAYPVRASPGVQSGYVRIAVTDHGVGMDDDTKKRIFDPFFTTKEVGAGSGLGLSTAYGIVRDHRGWIDCDSTPDVGTSFTVHLPVAAGKQRVERRKSPQREPLPAGSETILVADDEAEVRTAAVGLLRRCGYTVLEAMDGREALFLAKSQSPEVDLVLLDLSMPEVTGLEVLKQLRDERAGIKVVIFTGQSSEEGQIPDADGVLRKPVSLVEIAGAVREVLDS